MRKPSLLALLSVGALVGCTSILGDFEVGGGGSSSGTTGEGGPCTECGGKCVDTQTDNANCGGCGMACQGEKTCQAGKCACAADKAFCNNQCVTASRTACGEACTPCQADEICNMGCVAAPLASIKTPPGSPIGWVGPDGKELTIEVGKVDAPGTIYECRTGPDATFTPTEPAWAPCDGGAGTGTIHTPKPNATTPEGTYRTEVRYRSDTFRSATATARYYVHHALDRVPTCPRAGKPEDGPHFTNDQFFAVAQQYGLDNQAIFPIGGTFPQPKNPSSSGDDIVLDNPFIKIPFKGMKVPYNLSSNGWPADNADYTLNDRSLRHSYVLNANRTLLLVRRHYVHPKNDSCVTTYKVGNEMAGFLGPADPKRGVRKLACEAFVLNSHGAAVCLGLDPKKPGTPALVPIDSHPAYPGNVVNGSTVTGTAGSNTVTFAGTPNNTFPPPNYFVFIANRWYKVVTTTALTANSTKVALGEALQATVANQTYRYTGPSIYDTIVAPTGYGKLVDDSVFFASGAKPGGPEHRTKCDKPGCGGPGTDKPWLTYLPP